MSSATSQQPDRRRVAVIGGGISGLAAAFRLHELAPQADVRLFEASDRLGGILQTEHRDGYLIEHSADNFITNTPWAVDFCRRLGFVDQLIPTNPQRKAFVVYRGQLTAVPDGFMLMAPQRLWPLMTTRLLSLPGKLRLLRERFVPARRDNVDESLASFATRRLGREAFERLVQPLVSGIYTADPNKLSLAATLPRFLAMERQYGSLIRAARQQAQQQDVPSAADDQSAGARYNLFMAPRDGMTSLTQAVANKLPAGCVQLNTPIQQLPRVADGWMVQPAGRAAERFDAIVIATPAHVAAKLLSDVDVPLANELRSIEHASTAIVNIAYRREQLGPQLTGFGFVVPAVERRKILAGSISSNKFPGRAPADCVLMRIFVGGALQPELLTLDDAALKQLVQQELSELLSARGDPLFAEVVRWQATMPQYHLGHCELVSRIEARMATINGLELAGNAFHGVGVPNCIHSGEQAAERIAAQL